MKEILITGIEGLFVIVPEIYGDERGYFLESFNEKEFNDRLGIDFHPVQDNESRSKRGVLRGLHFQNNPYAQAKLVRVVDGEVYDVAVDLRPNSSTYGKWYGVILSSSNHKQFYIPKGFAHGFIVLSSEATFQYKCDDYYHPESEGGIAWDSVGIDWFSIKDKHIFPDVNPAELILSEKDRNRIGANK